MELKIYEDIFKMDFLEKLINKSRKKLLYFFTYNEGDRDILYNNLDKDNELVVLVYENHKLIFDCKSFHFMLEETIENKIEKKVYYSLNDNRSKSEKLNYFYSFLLTLPLEDSVSCKWGDIYERFI